MSYDMEVISGVILLLCLVSLTNANTSPAIDRENYVVCEDVPIGGFAFAINATDAEGDKLTYSLTGSNAVYFIVDGNTGNVTVRRPLNRETDDILRLGVAVSDGPNTTPGDLNIILSDANDNNPIFQDSSYDTDVLENVTIGTSLFRVRAIDDDTSTAGVVKYRIDEVTPSDGSELFSIAPNTGDVKLNGSLNYNTKSTYYRLKINATDGGGRCHFPDTKFMSSAIFSFITVVDVPDLDPQFLGLPYVTAVDENSPVDTPVYKVTAIDQDTGINDKITYSIEASSGAGKNLFKISSEEGTISVQQNIDREVLGDTITLTIKATESKPNIHGLSASATASVLININDVNDNKPEFYKCDPTPCVKASDFTGEVPEHSSGSVPINIVVKDLDKAARTALVLEGADKDVFSVQPQLTNAESVVQLLIKQPENLDFERKQQMVLTVIATDQDNADFRSTATVTINIKDINDHSPTFPKDTYKLNVPEHSPAGTVLDTITASDPDTMDQGKLKYQLLPESIRVYFDVEQSTGKVSVKNQTLLDREVRSLYSATLQARDTDDKPGSTQLEITLTDINDQPPVFNRKSYLDFVKEGGTLNLQIEATDADDSTTDNSKITFAIEPSRYSKNFTIHRDTGVLTNSGQLDREALDPNLEGEILLNVSATDRGTPALKTIVPVIINLEDINDNKPVFGKPSYKFSVKEGERGAFVGLVYAEDGDQTKDFNRTSFSIIEGGSGFIIRTSADGKGYRGNITVDPDINLDYESVKNNLKLKIEATDLGDKKAEVIVEVEVLDVNDERPEFPPLTEPVKVTVKENTTIFGAVGRFTAEDKDGNHSLIYELDSIKCRCVEDPLSPCKWFIVEPTGEVKVNPEFTLDYELCDQVLIEAQVVDEYTEKGPNNSVTPGKMEINIEDINDNAPEFSLSDSVAVVVSETASKGSSVARVTATDRDSGDNAVIEFKVSGVQFQDNKNETNNMRILFEAVTTQQDNIYVGIIQTKEGLDLKLNGKYLVTLTATDTGGLSTSTVLEIFSVNKTYNIPLRFIITPAEVENNQANIIRALTTATRAAVEVVAIRPVTEEVRAESGAIMEAYFIYSNGSALTEAEVGIILSASEHVLVLSGLGLVAVGGNKGEVKDTDTVQYVLIGLVGGLVIVLAVLTSSLVCTRRNYRRKMKAAKAMNSASKVTSDNQKTGQMVPGTNKYTMEGANPVLNLNIDTAMVLGLDEGSSDVDKVSLNSLDCNDDMSMSEKDTKPIMMIHEEDEEPPGYIEPLGEALAQRDQKKGSDEPHVGYNNPIFSTTDL